MDIADLHGKAFTLWFTNEANESAIFPGVARYDGPTLVIERALSVPFEIQPEWYEQIQTVKNQDARNILQGADYFLRLYVGDLPQEGS